MKVTERVAVVGSGSFGFGLSSRIDCNVYLLNGGEQLALIDSGCGREPERILDRVDWCGFDVARISWVLLTHSHADHSAGAAFFNRTLGARVLAPSASAAALRQADEEAIGLRLARQAGGYPLDFSMPSVPVESELDEGSCVHVGDLEVKVLALPGHSADHIGYCVDLDGIHSLFCGDVLLADGRIMLLATPDCEIQGYQRSIERLATLPLQALFPGHGAFTLTEASQAVEHAQSHFQRLRVPPSY